MSELLPCPFCGGSASQNVERGWHNERMTEVPIVQCIMCTATKYSVNGWNTRVLQWRPIETAPIDQHVLLWWIGTDKPVKKAPPTATIGKLSAIEKGMVWDGKRYSPIAIYTHWMPLPPAPEK